MARRNHRRPDEPRPSRSVSAQRTETWRGEEWTVRTVTGSGATKAYRCPGCDQLVAAGVPHVVVWPYADLDAADRRHWHVTCWPARDRRGPRGWR